MNAPSSRKKFWNLYHDFSEEAREAGYLPILSNNPGRGFPEESAWLTEQLKSPEFRQNLAEEYAAFWTAYQQDRDLLRFHYHKPKEIWGEPARSVLASHHLYLSVDGSTFGQAVYL